MELDTPDVSTLTRLGLFKTLPRSPPLALAVRPDLGGCITGTPPRVQHGTTTVPDSACQHPLWDAQDSHSQSTLPRILPHHAVDCQVRIYQAVVEPTRTRSPGEVQVLRQEGGSHHAHRLLHPTSRPQLTHAWGTGRGRTGAEGQSRQQSATQAAAEVNMQPAATNRQSAAHSFQHTTSRVRESYLW